MLGGVGGIKTQRGRAERPTARERSAEASRLEPAEAIVRLRLSARLVCGSKRYRTISILGRNAFSANMRTPRLSHT